MSSAPITEARLNRQRTRVSRYGDPAEEQEIKEALMELSNDRDFGYEPSSSSEEEVEQKTIRKRRCGTAPSPTLPSAQRASALFARALGVPAFTQQLARLDTTAPESSIVVRTALLAVRDIAGAAVALGVRREAMAPAWAALAEEVAGLGLPANQPTAMYQACVRAAIREATNHHSTKSLKKAKARQDYELKDVDFVGVPCAPGGARLYYLESVQRMAHAQHGDAGGVAAARQMRKQRTAERRAVLDAQALRRKETRMAEVMTRLAAASLPATEAETNYGIGLFINGYRPVSYLEERISSAVASAKSQRRALLKERLSRNGITAADAADSSMFEEYLALRSDDLEGAVHRFERQQQLVAWLHAGGLVFDYSLEPCRTFVDSGGSLQDVAAAMQALADGAGGSAKGQIVKIQSEM